MSSHDFTVDDEIKTTEFTRPHVVILGAGASLAAFPNGDRNGLSLPVIKNFVEVVGLVSLLERDGVSPPYNDFEAIYSDIAVDPKKSALRIEIETRVHDYFSRLRLPDAPTLYDHLVLSLRPKDVIATFNWDPFLRQAAHRNYAFAKPPTILFLHGNVAVSYCLDCKVSFGRNQYCRHCGKLGVSSPLLYPVKEKDYQADPYIASDWRAINHALKTAWAVTFFGYGAPKTDVEAIRLLKSGWGPVEKRELEETEIIDVRPENELTETWSPFIHTHHSTIRRSFYESFIGRHPRRSCEALWAQLMECRFIEGTEIPKVGTLDELYKWYQPRLDAEADS
jgi:hypothetical protein